MNEQKSQTPSGALPLDWRPEPQRRTRRAGRLTTGCLVVVLAATLCIGVTGFTFDRLCSSNLSQLIPFYPGSQMISERHSFLTMYGIGETVVILHSDDDPNVVNSWYGRTMGGFRRRSIQETIIGAQLVRGNFSVTGDVGGQGTQIILYGNCIS
jgi:hypothetical protein